MKGLEKSSSSSQRDTPLGNEGNPEKNNEISNLQTSSPSKRPSISGPRHTKHHHHESQIYEKTKRKREHSSHLSFSISDPSPSLPSSNPIEILPSSSQDIIDPLLIPSRDDQKDLKKKKTRLKVKPSSLISNFFSTKITHISEDKDKISGNTKKKEKETVEVEKDKIQKIENSVDFLINQEELNPSNQSDPTSSSTLSVKFAHDADDESSQETKGNQFTKRHKRNLKKKEEEKEILDPVNGPIWPTIDSLWDKMMIDLGLNANQREFFDAFPNAIKSTCLEKRLRKNRLRSRLRPQRSMDDLILALKKNDLPDFILLEYIESLRLLLATQSANWIQLFRENDGIHLLLDMMVQMNTIPSFESSTQTKIQIEIITIIESLLDVKTQLESFISPADDRILYKLTLCSTCPHIPTRSKIYRLIASIAMFTHSGSRRVLEAFDYFKYIHREKYRFFHLLETLHHESMNPTFPEICTSIITLINALINTPEDLDERMQIRLEFISIGLGQILHRFRQFSISHLPPSPIHLPSSTLSEGNWIEPILTQISSYDADASLDDEEFSDRLSLFKSIHINHGLDILNERIQPFDYLHLAFSETIKHLFAMPLDKIQGPRFWFILCKIVQQLTSHCDEIRFTDQIIIETDELLSSADDKLQLVALREEQFESQQQWENLLEKERINYETKYETSQLNHNQQINELKSHHTIEIDRIKSKHDTHINDTIDKINRSHHQEIHSKISEIENLRDSERQYLDQISNLEKAKLRVEKDIGDLNLKMDDRERYYQHQIEVLIEKERQQRLKYDHEMERMKILENDYLKLLKVEKEFQSKIEDYKSCLEKEYREKLAYQYESQYKQYEDQVKKITMDNEVLMNEKLEDQFLLKKKEDQKEVSQFYMTDKDPNLTMEMLNEKVLGLEMMLEEERLLHSSWEDKMEKKKKKWIQKIYFETQSLNRQHHELVIEYQDKEYAIKKERDHIQSQYLLLKEEYTDVIQHLESIKMEISKIKEIQSDLMVQYEKCRQEWIHDISSQSKRVESILLDKDRERDGAEQLNKMKWLIESKAMEERVQKKDQDWLNQLKCLEEERDSLKLKFEEAETQLEMMNLECHQRVEEKIKLLQVEKVKLERNLEMVKSEMEAEKIKTENENSEMIRSKQKGLNELLALQEKYSEQQGINEDLHRELKQLQLQLDQIQKSGEDDTKNPIVEALIVKINDLIEERDVLIGKLEKKMENVEKDRLELEELEEKMQEMKEMKEKMKEMEEKNKMEKMEKNKIQNPSLENDPESIVLLKSNPPYDSISSSIKNEMESIEIDEKNKHLYQKIYFLEEELKTLRYEKDQLEKTLSDQIHQLESEYEILKSNNTNLLPIDENEKTSVDQIKSDENLLQSQDPQPSQNPPPPPPPPFFSPSQPVTGGAPPPPPPSGMNKKLEPVIGLRDGCKPLKSMRQFPWQKLALCHISKSIFSTLASPTPLIDLDLNSLEPLFSSKEIHKPSSQSQSRGTDKITKDSLFSVVEPRRLQNVAIFLQHFKISPSQIHQSILMLDEQILTLEITQKLVDNLPTSEEQLSLQSYLESGKSIDRLENVDRFFLMLLSIPQVHARLSCFKFKLLSTLKKDEIKSSLLRIKRANTVMNQNKDTFKVIVYAILAMGNYLNFGTSRGSARGFHLSSILLLDEIKANQIDHNHGKIMITTPNSASSPKLNWQSTLLSVLIEWLEEKSPETLQWSIRMEDANFANKVVWAQVQEDLSIFIQGSLTAQQQYETIEKSPNQWDIFHDIMPLALKQSQTSSTELESLFQKVDNEYHDILVWHGCEIDMPPETFYGIVMQFASQFEKTIKELKLQKTRALKLQRQVVSTWRSVCGDRNDVEKEEQLENSPTRKSERQKSDSKQLKDLRDLKESKELKELKSRSMTDGYTRRQVQIQSNSIENIGLREDKVNQHGSIVKEEAELDLELTISASQSNSVFQRRRLRRQDTLREKRKQIKAVN